MRYLIFLISFWSSICFGDKLYIAGSSTSDEVRFVYVEFEPDQIPFIINAEVCKGTVISVKKIVWDCLSSDPKPIMDLRDGYYLTFLPWTPKGNLNAIKKWEVAVDYVQRKKFRHKKTSP